jgi:aldehyde dehydrogenase (NAD+)
LLCKTTSLVHIVRSRELCIVYLLKKYWWNVENAIAIQNGVAQGLSSAIMTNNLREAELFYQ